MKINKLLAFAILLTLCSCTKEDEPNLSESENYQFDGSWSGLFECTGPLSEENQELTIIIQQLDNNFYLVSFGDGLDTELEAFENRIPLNNIIWNADQTYDVVRIDGYLEILDFDKMAFVFDHEVDKEGLSQCEMMLQKSI